MSFGTAVQKCPNLYIFLAQEGDRLLYWALAVGGMALAAVEEGHLVVGQKISRLLLSGVAQVEVSWAPSFEDCSS